MKDSQRGILAAACPGRRTRLPRRLPLAPVIACWLAACAAPQGADRPYDDPVLLGQPPGRPLPAGVTTPVAQPAASGGPYRGVVAASEPEAAEAAAAVLARGGNAVDAAAVALLVLAVVEPQSSGIGGGAFMLIHHGTTGETIALDARETAPASATAEMFGDASFAVASTSGLAVGVPGAVLGINAALQHWGTLSLGEALQPAIALAESGFIVGSRLAESIEAGIANGGRLAHEPGNPAYDAARDTFAPNGVPLAAGDLLVQAQLTATLRAIAARGPQVLHDCGDDAGIARAIIAAQRAHRGAETRLAGRMSCADLAGAAAAGPVMRAPLRGRYRGLVVTSMPPPSSGGLCLIQMLSMVERFPLGHAAAGFGFGTPQTLTVMQDAMRLCFADRAMWMGDADARPDLPPVAGLIDPGYVHRRAASCPDGDAAAAAYCLKPGVPLAAVRAGDPRPDGSGRTAAWTADAATGGLETTHVTVADAAGTVVSATATIESLWGTGLMVPGAGFLLNNELTDFNLRPVANSEPAAFNPGANDAAAGRRPRSSMAPTLLFSVDADGREHPIAAFGSPGGATIINTVFAVTLNLVDHGMALATAIDAPRLSLTSHADGATTAIEAGFDTAVLERLSALGYRFGTPAPIGSVQAIVIDPATGAQYGAADRRRRGTVIGLPAAVR